MPVSFKALQTRMEAHDISETARKLVKPPSSLRMIGPTTLPSSSPMPPTTNTTETTPIRTVTFDENSPAEVEARGGGPVEQEEEKKQDNDDDRHDSQKPSILRTPHPNKAMRSNFGLAVVASKGKDPQLAPTTIYFGSSPDSFDATPSSNRPSPFRLETSAKNNTLIEHPSISSMPGTPVAAGARQENDDSPMLNASDPHGFSYASVRTIEMLDSFAHDSSDDDGTIEEWSVNSPLTTYQRNAENLTYRETKRWSRRVKELEEELKVKTDHLEQSQKIIQELRDDLVEQDQQAKRQVQKLYQTFQEKIKILAESVHARVDALDDKHDWTKAAVDRLVHDVEFFDRPDSVASDLSETLHSESENELYAAGLETHMNFLKSPNGITSVRPALALPSVAMEEWKAEKAQLVEELEMTKTDLELAKATSESLQSMLAAKDDSAERDELRRTNAKQQQIISELEAVVATRTHQCKDLQNSLIQAQSDSCRPTQPKSTRSSFGLFKRPSSAKHKRKAPSPIKLNTPNKLLKDTISTLRFQVAASDSKQADLATSLDRVRKQCLVQQATASQLANEVTRLKIEKLKLAEYRLSLTAQISRLECKIKDQASELDLARASSKMALKEKGQLRNEVSELEQLLSSEKQVAKTLEEIYKKSEDRKSKQLQELQDLDKQSTVYIAELKGRIVHLEKDRVQLERNMKVLGAQVTAYEKKIRELGTGSCISQTSKLNNQADKVNMLQRTLSELDEKFSHAVETENELIRSKYCLSEAYKERDALVRRLDDIADRLLCVQPDENDTNQRHGCSEAIRKRVEELLAAERDLSTTKTQLEKSSAEAMRYWTKCMRWESTYDRAVGQLQHVQTELRHLQAIANERNIENTVQKQKTEFEKRKAAALAVSCRKQQRELDNIAAALFNAKPSPPSASHG